MGVPDSFCLFLHSITIMFILTVETNSYSMKNKIFTTPLMKFCSGMQAGHNSRGPENWDKGHNV